MLVVVNFILVLYDRRTSRLNPGTQFSLNGEFAPWVKGLNKKKN